MANEEKAADALEAIARAAHLLLRLKIHELKGDRTQSEMILFLNEVGFTSGEIIDFLGATATTVRPILSRGRKKKAGKE
jgi:hypothetical protein